MFPDQGPSPSTPGTEIKNARQIAFEDLDNLLKKKSQQILRYGTPLSGHLLFRHQLVHSFFKIQAKRPGEVRRKLALQVAQVHGRGEFTARWIVKWEKLWICSQTIPSRITGSNGNEIISLFEDEGFLMAVREHMEQAGDSKLSSHNIVLRCKERGRAWS